MGREGRGRRVWEVCGFVAQRDRLAEVGRVDDASRRQAPPAGKAENGSAHSSKQSFITRGLYCDSVIFHGELGLRPDALEVMRFCILYPNSNLYVASKDLSTLCPTFWHVVHTE
jgi:hypothetical protein